MSAHRKNVVVGITVLIAIIALCWMLLQFGGMPAALFTQSQMPVEFVAPRADGLGQGSAIFFRGVEVGRITKIARSPDNKQIIIQAMIDRNPPLPGDLVGVIKVQSLLGAGTSILLQQPGETGTSSAATQQASPTTAPVATLQPHQKIPTTYVGLNLLPPEFSDLAQQLDLVARQMHESHLIDHMNQAVEQARDMITSLRTMVDNPKLRDDVQTTMDNLRQTTGKVNVIATNIEKFSGQLHNISTEAQTTLHTANTTLVKAQGHINDLSNQLSDRLTQMSKILATFQSITMKIDSGKGTAGALINDPRLYDSLVVTSKQLNMTLADIKRLVEQWEQEGIYFNLSK